MNDSNIKSNSEINLNFLKLNFMKATKFFVPIFLVAFLFVGCSDDDDGENPEPVNEEELITTMRVTLVPQGGGDTIVLESKDLDGDGPDAPEISVSDLTADTTYDGSILLLNETETPAEDITEEVAEEDEDHQFFFEGSGSITGVSYSDADGDGNPIGILFEMTTGGAGDASLAITLRHEPKKPNDGTLADAGGETDIAQTFSVSVQ